MGDIKDPRLLYLKGGLFVATGLFASALLILECPNFKVVALLAVAVWSFARAYYFAFYVVQHYVDPGYRFAGLGSFARYAWSRRKENDGPKDARNPDPDGRGEPGVAAGKLNARPKDWPEGIDYAWLGCDGDDHVACFTNAGLGPIPLAVLARRDLADTTEALVRTLPLVGGYEMTSKQHGPAGSSADLAQCGFYVFDWLDVHRQAGRTNCYEAVCRPLRPLKLSELLVDLAELAGLVRFTDLRFGDTLAIPAALVPECAT